MNKLVIFSIIAIFCFTTVFAKEEDVLRKLERRTRQLLRNVEHRNENRREHERSRREIRRLEDRIHNGKSSVKPISVDFNLISPNSAQKVEQKKLVEFVDEKPEQVIKENPAKKPKDSIFASKFPPKYDEVIQKQLEKIIKDAETKQEAGVLESNNYEGFFSRAREFFAEKISQASSILKSAKDSRVKSNAQNLFSSATNIMNDLRKIKEAVLRKDWSAVKNLGRKAMIHLGDSRLAFDKTKEAFKRAYRRDRSKKAKTARKSRDSSKKTSKRAKNSPKRKSTRKSKKLSKRQRTLRRNSKSKRQRGTKGTRRFSQRRKSVRRLNGRNRRSKPRPRRIEKRSNRRRSTKRSTKRRFSPRQKNVKRSRRNGQSKRHTRRQTKRPRISPNRRSNQRSSKRRNGRKSQRRSRKFGRNIKRGGRNVRRSRGRKVSRKPRTQRSTKRSTKRPRQFRGRQRGRKTQRRIAQRRSRKSGRNVKRGGRRSTVKRGRPQRRSRVKRGGRKSVRRNGPKRSKSTRGRKSGMKRGNKRGNKSRGKRGSKGRSPKKPSKRPNKEPGQKRNFNFIIITDTHIDNTTRYPHSIEYARKTVTYINNLVKRENIAFVVFLGDLTDKATMYKEFKDIFGRLTVPYLPLPGNHDVWRNAGSWYEPQPTGDLIFGQVFRENFEKFPVKVEWNSQPTFNDQIQSMSHFQNFHFKFGGVVFIGLDYNSRKSGRPQNRGVVPNGELHETPGGTFDWLNRELPKIAQESFTQVVFLQHHPFVIKKGKDPLRFGFTPAQKRKVRDLYQKYLPKDKIFGMLGGHCHRYFDGTSFPVHWPKYRQYETRANGRLPVFSIVKVTNSKISSLRQVQIN